MQLISTITRAPGARTLAKVVALAALATLAGGCSFLNPYESKFTCPDAPNGKCISVTGAYQESLKPLDPAHSEEGGKPCVDCVKGEAASVASGLDVDQQQLAKQGIYQSALYAKQAKLLKDDPVAPMLVPPTVLRVLLLGYEGDGREYFEARRVFLKVDDFKWLLSEHRVGAEDE